MSDHVLLRTSSGFCYSKRPYLTVEEASRAAIALLTLPDVRRVRVYQCHWCDRYHVTRGKGGDNWVWQAEREESA